jgi:3-hydroxyisobutyrate dehydrogenase-like beta-hydroxyacid dehydrogenase
MARQALKVGFIGLGQQGKPMALNAAREFDLAVYDVRPEPCAELAAAGARVARSAEEAARHATIVEVAVFDDAQLETAVLGESGVIRGAEPGSVLVIHSTVRPKTVRQIAEIAAAGQIETIDAPVSGGERAATRDLCFMVGGDAKVVERCRPVFTTSGRNIFHVGPLGAGITMKLVHQLMVCINMLAAHEAMSLAEEAGLDRRALQQVVHSGTAQSQVVDSWLDFTPGEHGRRLFYKDLTLVLELAHELGVSLPGAAMTRELLSSILKIG